MEHERRGDRMGYTLAGDVASADTLAVKPALTAMGALIGTPLYMAPETAHGPATIASDVLALGVLAHELFAGVRPFETPPVVLAWTGEPLPEVSLDGIVGLQPVLAQLVRAALSESRARRPSAAELADGCGA